MLTSLHLHEKSREVCIKVRSPPASLVFIGQITEHTTVKWPIGNLAFASNILVGSGSICMYDKVSVCPLVEAASRWV